MGDAHDLIDVAWVTCKDLPEPDPDEAPTLAALRNAGLSVETLAWDGPDAERTSRFSICVLRSCWNYFEHPDAFKRWVAQATHSSALYNRQSVVLWNLHKRYLGALAARGVPIVPTLFLERGGAAPLTELIAREGWSDVVIKPAISAGSFATACFREAEFEAAQAFLIEHLELRDMLVQCFVPSVQTTGEKSLVWIDGDFTHAVIKQPRFLDDDESVSAALPVDGATADLGRVVLASACQDISIQLSDLLYARVDIVQHGGQWVVSELELLEPSLFLSQSPAALERFVDALSTRCR
ncbi:MAG: hypothetical protein ACI8QZ_000259 [Chlamydiales bacterium]|jgi:hypothetical protein